MDEQTKVPSVVYHVDTDDCGGGVLDYIRDTVQMNNDKLDALLACNACNESTTPEELGKFRFAEMHACNASLQLLLSILIVCSNPNYWWTRGKS